MRSSKGKGEAELEQSGRSRSDSDAEWEAKEAARRRIEKRLGTGDQQPAAAAVAVNVDADPNALRPGDVLVFMIPKTNPTLTDRFIRFMQRAKGAEHNEDAEAVHVAIVTKGGATPQISHYTKNGLGEDALAASAYQDYQYEIFRPSDNLRPSMEQKTRNAKQAPDNPSAEIETKYSFPKMIAAFLKGEGKLPDKLRKSLPDTLYKRGYGEHVCSTYVAAVIKDAQKEANSESKTVDTSFLVPSRLFAKLKNDNVNFQRIVPVAMTNQQKCDALMRVVDSMVERLQKQKKAVLGINKEKIQQKIDQINEAKVIYQRTKSDDPAVLVSIMANPVATNTGSGFKQSQAAQAFLQEARKLGVDTSRQEAALSVKAKSSSEYVNDAPQPPRMGSK